MQWPVLWLLRAFVDPDPVTGALASDYFAILIYGAPAVLGTYALSGWFLGMQNSRMLMVTSIVINLSNIAVSLLLVYGLGWKIPGVAVGTLVAQWRYNGSAFSQVCGCFVVIGFNVRSGAR